MDGTIWSCPIAGFNISGTEPSGPINKEFVATDVRKIQWQKVLT
jgi:hypothetical protein